MCWILLTLSQNISQYSLLHTAWPQCCNTTWLFNNNKSVSGCGSAQVTRAQVSTTSWGIRCLPSGVVIDRRYWSAQFGDLKIYLTPWYDVLWMYANWDKLFGITFKWHSCNLRVAFQKRFLNNGSRSAYVNQNCKKSFSFSLLWIGRLLA